MREPGTAPQISTRTFVARVALVWLGVAAFLLLRARDAIAAMRFGDPDDALRLVQVRSLLAGQNWFDLHLYRIDPPGGVLMHWSRLVDAPIAAVIALLRPVLGQPSAELAAIMAVPLLTLLCAMLLAANIARRLSSDQAVLYACLLWLLAFLPLAQMAPLRIDHHGWQIVALLAAANGLFMDDDRRGGWTIGAALATGLAISLELLPYIGIFGAVLLLRWLKDRDRRAGLTAMLDSLAAVSAALYLVTRGLDPASYCDIASPGYLAGFAVAAIGVRLAARRPLQPVALLAVLALTAAAALAAFVLLAPLCSRGPFAALDPLVYQVWYVRVLEGRPVWHVPAPQMVTFVVPGIAAIVIAALLAKGAGSPGRRADWREYALLMTGFALMSVAVSRAGGAAGALAIPALAGAVHPLLARLQTAQSAGRKALVLAALLLAVIPGIAGLAALQLAALLRPALLDEGTAGAETNAAAACNDPRAIAALSSLPAATIMAPLDLGPAILQRTPHSVVATSHHRASAAMHDVIAAFTAAPAEAQQIAHRHGARYVLTCSGFGEDVVYRQLGPQGLMAVLDAGRPPAWLAPVALPAAAGPLRLWRVQ